MDKKWIFPDALKNRSVKNYNLFNWILGNLLVALGICISTKSGFGLSMIGAGPYIVHVWLRDQFPWFTQGTAEYVYQFLVMIAVCIIIRQCKIKYLVVFAEAMIAGFIIDGWFAVIGGNAVYPQMGLRIVCMVVGLFVTGLGVAFFFRTNLPLQAYDFAVIKIASTYSLPQKKVKLATDWTLFIIALTLSLTLTKKLTGIGIGTVFATVCNAFIIDFWGKYIDRFEKKEKK